MSIALSKDQNNAVYKFSNKCTAVLSSNGHVQFTGKGQVQAAHRNRAGPGGRAS